MHRYLWLNIRWNKTWCMWIRFSHWKKRLCSFWTFSIKSISAFTFIHKKTINQLNRSAWFHFFKLSKTCLSEEMNKSSIISLNKNSISKFFWGACHVNIPLTKIILLACIISTTYKSSIKWLSSTIRFLSFKIRNFIISTK